MKKFYYVSLGRGEYTSGRVIDIDPILWVIAENQRHPHFNFVLITWKEITEEQFKIGQVLNH